MKSRVYCTALLMVISSHAAAERGLAIKAAGNANASLMATPPLPDLSVKSKETKFNVQLAYFSAKTDPNDTEGVSEPLESDVDYSGYGSSVMMSNSGSGIIGLYALASMNQLSGNFSNSFAGFNTEAKDVSSTLMQVGAGVTLSFFRNSFLPTQVFLGPSYSTSSVQQTVVTDQGDDFDMTVNPTSLSYFAGGQVEVPLFGIVTLNPYFLISDYFSEDSKCHDYEANVRSNGPLWDMADMECQEPNGGYQNSKVYYDVSYTTYGLNLKFSFADYDLSINLLSEVDEFKGFQQAEQQIYALSFSF